MNRSRSMAVRMGTVAVLAAGAFAVIAAARDVGATRPASPIAAEPPAPLVYVRSADRLTTVDAARAEVAVSVRAGVSSPDGSRVFSVVPSATGSGARLRVTDPHTGDRVWEDGVPGGVDVRVASYDGSVVALMPPTTGPEVGYPAGRASTDVVIEPTTGGPVRRHHLAGNFEPEAFSRDGSGLFLIEYLPAMAPTGYRVRQLDLATGRVRPVDSPDIGPNQTMGGTARAQVMSSDGLRLYTLYSVPAGVNGGPHGVADEGRAFVHVLDLEEKWAHCLDLPAPYGRQRAASGPIAVSPDGRRLYVVDPDSGSLISVDTEHLAPSAVAPSVVNPWPTAAAVGPDGHLYVDGSGRLQVVDPTTMAVVDSWRSGYLVASITVAAGGDLYVAKSDGTVTVADSAGGRRRTIDLPEHTPLVVGPASVSLPGPRNVLECAC